VIWLAEYLSAVARPDSKENMENRKRWRYIPEAFNRGDLLPESPKNASNCRQNEPRHDAAD
jgi:hypothetical protein